MTKQKNEKRPEDWTKSERFVAIVTSEGLSDEQLSAYCLQQGIYVHHIEHWKLSFLGDDDSSPAQGQQKFRQLTQQVHKLKRDITRKDKALAETAALLVLQKKYRKSGATRKISNVG